ncbi:leucine-rich repeat and calponin homology domain-containing protein 1 isoform X3 [Rousettus aegyptiacus]|uniref:leucine-rich repeat and calponin homology domain-containing protein 1 isoform X3 n=1 Tax=Rousettus aegyptiacus TaxID=9407 RepID=UPI00168D99D1|nr:leucine-rich repeat and calponin homology domain-containing protein 1 isoform X3 [Rousettus aegyptiacus]
MATLGSEPQPFVPAVSVATLHPHHHPHHHPYHHQQQHHQQQHHGGAGANGGPGGGGGGSSGGFNVPLNRGLERALEEAANSGGLNLSARKLKEFPRTAAPGHDLSDTVQADLSKNRLVEVPMELCQFVSLEVLNLYHNCIKVIPEAIVNLQMLTYLNLSRNQLSALPACLCGLPLKVLIASNNKLGSLPEEIGQLKQLMELDVSCNEITALPQQIGQLKSLRELNVRRNYLKVLPQELVDLPLVKFDFSCNKVLVIPICFREMKQLQVLLLENNPLQSPPAQICTKGKVHIFKYLSIQACQIKTADSLYLHTMERPQLHQHVEDSKKDSDSGVGSDNGDKRLSATEPSDEDTVSLNVPMSNIMEEEQIIKEDSCHHLSPVKGEFHQEFQPEPSLVGDNDSLGEERDQFTHGTDVLHSEFINYNKDGAEDCEELLRIEEDTHWQSEGIISSSKDQNMDIVMIEHMREAIDLLQDPSRLSTDITERSVVNFYPKESAEALELQDSALNGQIQLETSPVYEVQNDLTLQSNGSKYSPNEISENAPAISPTTNSTAPFGLKPRSVFLRPQRNLESIDPQFTIRRKMEQMREEKELVEQLRESIEMRLKVSLHEDLGAALMDGVVLCHLVNHIRPRSVASIHVPSPAVPKLSMAKCRRNVENFLEACRKLGVPEEPTAVPSSSQLLAHAKDSLLCGRTSVMENGLLSGLAALPHFWQAHPATWRLNSVLPIRVFTRSCDEISRTAMFFIEFLLSYGSFLRYLQLHQSNLRAPLFFRRSK